MYPVTPGSDVLAIHGPRFESVVVHLANGKQLELRADGVSSGEPSYVKALTINGATWDRSWLAFSDVAAGATLEFQLGPTPSDAWGGLGSEPPPSPAADDR